MSRIARLWRLGVAALLGAVLLLPGAGCNTGKNPPSGSPGAAPSHNNKPAEQGPKDNKPQHEPG